MNKLVITSAVFAALFTASTAQAGVVTGIGTAYHFCDGSTSMTASGKVARVGYVANNFLPLGTWIQMTKPKTVMGRSFFKVMDRGGGSFALDFWAQDCAWMNSWGVRTVSFKAVKSSDLYRGLPVRGWSLKRSKKGWKFSWNAKLSSKSSSTKAIAAKMPKNWKTWIRIGRCEQPGSGAWGIRWNHPGPRYQGGLGFYSGTWDGYKPRGYPDNAGQATWRQQMNVANRVARSVGFSAWGCN
jgi:hypothetical protein